jgi:hypothetical protein
MRRRLSAIEEQEMEESVLIQKPNAINDTNKGLAQLLDDMDAKNNAPNFGGDSMDQPGLEKYKSDGYLLLQRASSDNKSQVVISKSGLVALADKQQSRDDVFGRRMSANLITKEQI